MAGLCSGTAGQSPPPDPATDPSCPTNIAPPVESERLLDIIPNNCGSLNLQNYQGLTPAEMFRIASEDSLDRGTFVLAGIYIAQGQWANANRFFGQGATGFGEYFRRRLWRSGHRQLHDMTEAVLPTLLHQDPHYFRRGTGSGWSRLRYALGQALWTHYDSSTLQFNYSDIVGSVAAVAISNAYYADNRNAGDAAAKLGFPIATDTARNILKEFWRESSIVAKDEIHEDEISEVDERRHRTNCRLWRATLRKH
jgi:hypothetical protein